MKVFLSIAVVFFFAFTSIKFNEKATAIVSKQQGLYWFVESEPTKEYKRLGAIEIKGIVLSTKYADIKNLIIKKAWEKYPDAEAIIFDGKFNAEVIKFK